MNVILNLPLHIWECVAQRTNPRFTREEKEKGKCRIPRKPQQWVPREIQPNRCGEIQTRARAVAAAEYKKQRENNEAILEVLAQFLGDTEDI